LIEIGAGGARDRLSKTRDISLTAWERANILARSNVENSRWVVAGLPEANLFEAFETRKWTRVALLVVAVGLCAVIALVSIIRLETKRQRAQEEIEQLAMTDQLTGLANRNQFNDRFDQSLKLARREDYPLVLMLLDLDKFKTVNDTFGHPIGDELLKKVAMIFTKHCRDTDVVARIGGDEFAILLVHTEEQRNIEMIANRIISEVCRPIEIDGNEMQIGTSIGISIFPRDGGDEENLIKNADLALYSAKDNGRNCFRIYQPKLENVA
jgi:diguanylate cyclase (GGDEF)-like protein